MLRRRTGDLEFPRRVMRLPPIEVADRVSYTAPFKPRSVAERRDHARPAFAREPAQRGEVEMIVVVVAEQNGIDRWQFPTSSAGGRARLGPKRPNGPASTRKRWIGEDSESRQLQQEGRMSNPCDRDLPGGDDGVQRRSQWRRQPLRPGGGSLPRARSANNFDTSAIDGVRSPPGGLKNLRPSQWSLTGKLGCTAQQVYRL